MQYTAMNQQYMEYFELIHVRHDDYLRHLYRLSFAPH